MIRFRSKKREAVYRQRRPLVAQLLADHPICERCGSNPSQDVHEIVSRARGGDILDPANLRCLCRSCHTWITLNPHASYVEGFSAHSWERDEYTSRQPVYYCQRHGGQEVNDEGVCVVCAFEAVP